jgi:hypothetical protein
LTSSYPSFVGQTKTSTIGDKTLPQNGSQPRIGLDDQELVELENQLVDKIIDHFKTNYNYQPAEQVKDIKEDIFYSPIGTRICL